MWRDRARPIGHEWNPNAPFVKKSFVAAETPGGIKPSHAVPAFVVGAIVARKKDKGPFPNVQSAELLPTDWPWVDLK